MGNFGPLLPPAFRMGVHLSMTCRACYTHPETTDEDRAEMTEAYVRECGLDVDRCGYCDAVLDVPKDCDGHFCVCAAEAREEYLAARGDYLYDLWKDEGRYG